MKPLRYLLAYALLVIGERCISGVRLLLEEPQSILAPRRPPLGMILLASIVGMAICTIWIAATWRAWS